MPLTEFDRGTNCPIRSRAVASKHEAGIMFPGKIAAYEVPGAMAAPPFLITADEHPERFDRAWATAASAKVPVKVGAAEKSPSRSAAVGTGTGVEVMPCRSRCPS